MAHITFTQPNSNSAGINCIKVALHPNGQWYATSQMHPIINGTNYYAGSLTIIWKAIFKTWQIWDNHLHPTDTALRDRTQLTTTVQQIIHNIQQVPNLKDMITNTTQELIAAKPTQYIYQWITNCQNHMTNYWKAEKLWDKLKTCNIWSYFAKCPHEPHTTATNKNLLHPP